MHEVKIQPTITVAINHAGDIKTLTTITHPFAAANYTYVCLVRKILQMYTLSEFVLSVVADRKHFSNYKQNVSTLKVGK